MHRHGAVAWAPRVALTRADLYIHPPATVMLATGARARASAADVLLAGVPVPNSGARGDADHLYRTWASFDPFKDTPGANIRVARRPSSLVAPPRTRVLGGGTVAERDEPVYSEILRSEDVWTLEDLALGRNEARPKPDAARAQPSMHIGRGTRRRRRQAPPTPVSNTGTQTEMGEAASAAATAATAAAAADLALSNASRLIARGVDEEVARAQPQEVRAPVGGCVRGTPRAQKPRPAFRPAGSAAAAAVIWAPAAGVNEALLWTPTRLPPTNIFTT